MQGWRSPTPDADEERAAGVEEALAFITPEERFAALVARFRDCPGVAYKETAKRGFGSTALKIDGKIFAMLVGGRLVVKLPRSRVAVLVDAGAGEPLDTGQGRLMKEWLNLAPDSAEDWATLTEEASRFVGGMRQGK